MSKSLKLFAGALGGTAVMLATAYTLADGFVVRPAPISERVKAAATNVADDVAETASTVAHGAGGLLVSAAHADEAGAQGYGIGRPATPEEIAAWDVNVMPDGRGLPEGSGSVSDGEQVFSDYCATCHGEFAEGIGNWPELAGGEGTLADKDPVKTVGSYWPYLSTAWDYVHRSMPFGNAQSLTADETYAIVAYILYSNFLVEDDFVLSKENFLEVEMPNADGFIVDDRAETEYPEWRAEPCMENCKDAVEITMRASVLDVTPNEGGDGEEEAALGQDSVGEEAAEAMQKTEAADAPAETVETAMAADEEADRPDPELVAAGEKVFRKCSACHAVGEGAGNKMGPHLNALIDRPVGGLEDYSYSGVMADHGGVWDRETLASFLADPRGTMNGTKMSFAGLRKDADIEAVIAYLQSAGQ